MKNLSSNRVVVISCAAVVAGMVGLSYAAVPLYDMFCRATGYAGTPQRAAGASTHMSERSITIRFDANTDPALNWSFQPDVRSVNVKIGENRLAFFKAANRETESVTGHATFNVVPESAGRYFNKIDCFCFTEQRLAGGATVEMPVSFFVDPAILEDRELRDLDEITLSYTFFRSAVRDAASALDPRGGRTDKRL